jgi:hypothetical protein
MAAVVFFRGSNRIRELPVFLFFLFSVPQCLGVCLRIQADLFFFEDNALDELSSETDFSLGINRDDG